MVAQFFQHAPFTSEIVGLILTLDSRHLYEKNVCQRSAESRGFLNRVLPTGKVFGSLKHLPGHGCYDNPV